LFWFGSTCSRAGFFNNSFEIIDKRGCNLDIEEKDKLYYLSLTAFAKSSCTRPPWCTPPPQPVSPNFTADQHRKRWEAGIKDFENGAGRQKQDGDFEAIEECIRKSNSCHATYVGVHDVGVRSITSSASVVDEQSAPGSPGDRSHGAAKSADSAGGTSSFC
jgi:hypothetical protein